MRKAKEKLKMAGVLIPESEKKEIQLIAERRNQTLTELVLTGIRMMTDFNDDFLRQIDEVAEMSKISTSRIMAQLLTVYVAQDSALLEIFGKSQTYKMSLQHDSSGKLITGDELSKKVFKETLAAAQNLKTRLKKSSKGKNKKTFISYEDASQLATQMTEIQPTL